MTFFYKWIEELLQGTKKGAKAEDLSNFVVKEVPIEDARKLANELYGLDIPKTITENSIPSSNMLLDDMTKLTPKESEEFYKKIKI